MSAAKHVTTDPLTLTCLLGTHFNQVLRINQAFTSAGTEAANSEMSKDNRYKAIVERAGAVFVPLVVKTLGVWPHLQIQYCDPLITFTL